MYFAFLIFHDVPIVVRSNFYSRNVNHIMFSPLQLEEILD